MFLDISDNYQPSTLAKDKGKSQFTRLEQSLAFTEILSFPFFPPQKSLPLKGKLPTPLPVCTIFTATALPN